MNDVTNNFILSKIIVGMQGSFNKCTTRLPITISLLNAIIIIITKLPAVCANTYECQLFTASYCLAFFGFFRIGEITVTRVEYIETIVALKDLTFEAVKGIQKWISREKV